MIAVAVPSLIDGGTDFSRRMFLGGALSATALCAGCATAAPRRDFAVYDGLQSYLDKPSLAPFGIRPIHWGDPMLGTPAADARDFPDKGVVQAYARSLPGGDIPIVLDIEQFPVIGPGAEMSVRRLVEVMVAFRRVLRGRSLGYYAVLPQADYWRAIAPSFSAEHRAWQRENDLLAAVEKRVDALYPSIYTFYPDRDGWVRYARAQVAEARRVSDKPVRAFLWPEYHSSGPVQGFLPADYWRLQLETLREIADGIVLFGGWDERARARRPWDANAPWWQELRAFMAEHARSDQVEHARGKERE